MTSRRTLFFILSLAILTLLVWRLFYQPNRQVNLSAYKYMRHAPSSVIPLSRQWIELTTFIIRWDRRMSYPAASRLLAAVASLYDDVLSQTNDSSIASTAVATFLKNTFPEFEKEINELVALHTKESLTLPPDVSRITAEYIDRFTNEDTQYAWNKKVPSEENSWYRRRGLPMSPTAAHWSYWNLPEDIFFPLPSPPASPELQRGESTAGSQEELVEKEQVIYQTKRRTSNDLETVLFWYGDVSRRSPSADDITPAALWQNILFIETQGTYDDTAYSSLQKLLAQTVADATTICWQKKFTYWRQRPSMKIPHLVLAVADPESPSYPGDLSCVAGAATTILKAKIPEKATLWQRIADTAVTAEQKAGTQWASDSTSGVWLGTKVAEAVLQKIKKPMTTPVAKEPKKPIALLSPVRRVLYALLNRLPTFSSPKNTEESRLVAATRDNPTSDIPLIALADFYRSLGKGEKGSELLEKALSINPTNDYTLVYLANDYRHHPEKQTRAEELLKKAISINPHRDWAYVQLGKLYYETGRKEEAEDMLRQAIATQPLFYANDGADIPLIELYQTLGRTDETITVLENILTTDPNPELFIRLADIYAALGNKEETFAVYDRAFREFPRSTLLRDHMPEGYTERTTEKAATTSVDIVK